MKILFAGDASNMHNSLAHALRRAGHEAVVASAGSRWMNTSRDIDLYRRPGLWGSLRYGWQLLRALPLMRGFDVVQLCDHIFFDLKPEKLYHILNYLKRHNGMVVLSALATDCVYVDACQRTRLYRYSDYTVGDAPSPYVGSAEYVALAEDNWQLPSMRRYSDHVMATIDGAVSALLEYDMAYRPLLGERLAYGGIPVDVSSLPMRELDATPQRVKFFLGLQSTRTIIKGTDRLLAALRRVHDRYPQWCEMEVVEDVPYAEYVERMRHSHVLLDQLYSYTPATNALLAMAQGLVAVSGAEPEYYDFIGEHDNHPIVNVSPLVEGDIDAQLEHLVLHRDELPARARASRAFVERHNDAPVVAQRFVEHWNKLIRLRHQP